MRRCRLTALQRIADSDCEYVLKATDVATMKPGAYTAKVTAKNRSGKSAAWKLASVTARFFSGKFIVEVDYELEGGVVKSASGRVWKK